MVRAAAILFSLSVASIPPAARAEDSLAEARSHFEKGWTAQNLGRFEEAVVHYKAAYALRPSPELLFNLGQVYRELKNCEQASFFYRRYLISARQDAPFVEKVKTQLEEVETNCKELEDVGSRTAGRLEPASGAREGSVRSVASPAQPSVATADTKLPSDTRFGAWPWIAVGTGLGIGGGGAALIALHRPEIADGVARSDHRLTRGPGIALLAGGVGLAAVGLVLSLLESTERAPATVAMVAPEASGWAAVLHGRF